MRASYLEIYNEEIRDLLQKDFKNKLELKESADQGVYVKDLSMFVLKSVSEIEHVFTVGAVTVGRCGWVWRLTADGGPQVRRTGRSAQHR